MVLTLVAALALVDLEFERVRAMAADAGIITIYVRELAVVFLVGILIAAFDNGAIQRSARRKVVNVGEGDLVADRIHVGHCRVLDLRINRRFRGATLMALQADHFGAERVEAEGLGRGDGLTGDVRQSDTITHILDRDSRGKVTLVRFELWRYGTSHR